MYACYKIMYAFVVNFSPIPFDNVSTNSIFNHLVSGFAMLSLDVI